MLYKSLVSKQKKNENKTFPEAASRALNPAVRFVLPDLELGTVFEENGNGNEEESEVKRGEEESWNSTKHLPKRRHFVKVIMNIICQGQRIHCRNFSTFQSLLCNIFHVLRANTHPQTVGIIMNVQCQWLL